MTPRGVDLARMLVGRGMKWRPGMAPLHVDGYGYIHGTHIPTAEAAADLDGNPYHYPDINDPGTTGCLQDWLWKLHPGWRYVGALPEDAPEAIAAAILKALEGKS